jgi:multiple sugar transport system ATP-binding protein
MNLAEAQLDDDGSPAIVLGDRRWPLLATSAVPRGGPVTIGLRPDAFTWPAPATGAQLDVTVAAVEFLGNGTLVMFEPPGSSTELWTARIDGNVPAQVGDRMTFGVDVDAAYFFDRKTGRALPAAQKIAVLV